jgi:transposase-like protein
MDVRENARTTRHSRMLMVQRLASGWSVAAVAAAKGVSPGTVGKWRDRHAAHGEAGLVERSSRSHRSPARLAVEAERFIQTSLREWAYAPRPSTPQPSVPPPCQPGSATTTVSGPIPLSAESHPSLTECGVECCRGLYAVGLSRSPPRRIVIPMDRQGY